MSKVALNEKQQEAVNYINGPLLILAGAGAGKTKTITERVINIIKSGINPENILCVTFTNKAASEMRERILDRMREENLLDEYKDKNYFYKREPMIKTFHSFCLYILKLDGERLGYNKNFTLMDPDDSRSIVKNFLESQDIDTKIYDPSKIRNAISHEKNLFNSTNDYEKKVASYSMEIILKTWRFYEEELKKQNAFDFDDLITKALILLRDNKDIRDKYNNRFKYIHIDEYQDTNNVQYQLSKLLVPNRKEDTVGEPQSINENISQNICVVGDTDQNIYSWRGANLKNIFEFEKDFKGTKTILLEENYRSTGNILKLANEIIKKNTIRKDKNLWTSASSGDEIEIIPSWDEESEAEYIALKIKELSGDKKDFNNIAVLYRTNFQSRVLEEKMLSHNIPYTVLGTRFFERKEIKDIMSYIRVILNPDSKVDLKRVLENPKRGVGKVTMAKVFAGETLSKSNDSKIKEVFDFLQLCRDKSKELSIHDLIDFILENSGLRDFYEKEGEEGYIRIANINELQEISKRWSDNTFTDSIDEFMEIASLSSDQDDDKKEKIGVRLMTVHASKGLEFDTVFIVGLEDGLFPSQNFGGKKKTTEENEEERRLFYVAVTRARKNLFLSYAEMRTIFGQKQMNMPSEFVSDVPPEISIVREQYFKQNRNKNKYNYYNDEEDTIYI